MACTNWLAPNLGARNDLVSVFATSPDPYFLRRGGRRQTNRQHRRQHRRQHQMGNKASNKGSSAIQPDVQEVQSEL